MADNVTSPMASSMVQQPGATAVALQRPVYEGGLGAGVEDHPPARHRPFMMRNKWAIPIASLIVFLGIWQIVGSQMSPLLFATPWAVAAATVDLARNGQLASAFGTAMGDFSLGFVLAVIFGISLGTLMGRSRIVERSLSPYINFLQAMPSIAAVPLVVIWFGVGYPARVVTVLWLAVLPILINTHMGTRNTPKSLREVAKIYKLSQFATLKRLVLPAAAPFIFTGLRRGLALGLIGMLISEMDISVNGLGGLVINYGDNLRTSYLLSAICIAALVGVITMAALETVRKYAFAWIDALAGHDAD